MGRVLRILLDLRVLLAVPPNNAIRVFWRRFLFLWKSVASILGLREPTPVMMSLAGSLSMLVCLPPEPKATVGHACTCSEVRVFTDACVYKGANALTHSHI